MRIFLSSIVGGLFSGAGIGFALYLFVYYELDSGSGNFISVQHPEYLAGMLGGIIGCFLGVVAGLFIAATELIGFKAVIVNILINAGGWIVLFVWTEGGILDEAADALLIAAALVIGALNGLIVSLLNSGRPHADR